MPSPGPNSIRQGDILAGKYRVERVIGSGGMGIVVAARHQQLDQLVAIKFVRDEAIGDEGAVERFLREARAAVKLKSEHAAKVLDVGTLESGAPYMVMEFLEGRDLGQVLENDGPLPIVAVTEWVLQACEAVAEAHAAGIVHRDLKPQNLFLARTVGGLQGIKVLDFGVSKLMHSMSGELGSLTRTRTMLGSPLYMAPEQMRSARDVNATADVWAFGVVLFELLTGRWPFEAETMPELCLKVVSEPPLSLAQLRPETPASLVRVVERCLSKDPTARFANAAELASALEPHVPTASRVWAERARMAMSSVSDRRLPDSAESAPRLLSGDASSVRTGTLSAWGSGGGARAASPRRTRVAIAAVAIAGAGIATAALVMHFTQAKPARGSLTVASSAVAPAPPLQPSAPAVAAVEVAPSALSLAPVDPPPSPTASAKTPSGHGIPAGASPGAKGAAHPHASAGPKATNPDDDIPALR
jgi:serine/threonine-protein kinase